MGTQVQSLLSKALALSLTWSFPEPDCSLCLQACSACEKLREATKTDAKDCQGEEKAHAFGQGSITLQSISYS